jgi:4'-phosphopantetheinyl transferase EntD
MIERIVPPQVRAVEGAQPPEGATPFAEEMAIVAGAVDKRRREFHAGRSCARLALARLGIADVPIPAGPRREPIWPSGVVGSITHCPGYVAAAVALAADLAALGIDAEERGAAGEDVEAFVCTPAERDRYRASGPECWRTLVFSAKESLFKALYPLRRFELDFADVEVALGPPAAPAQGESAGGAAQGRFRVAAAREVPVAADLERVEGRFLVAGRHLFTAAWLPPGP